jgi:hypothetical protein
MKKILTVLLIISILTAASPIFAVSSPGLTSPELLENTIRALGIMNGDENGNLRLHFYVKRSEFAKMMVQASSFKDSVGGGSNTSIFSDVPYDHWAAEYIKTAVNAGWFSGYLDGTFRPDKNITSEEVATALLRLLGYTQTDINGPYPNAQLSKFNALGLNRGIDASQGRFLTRKDLMSVFYNLMEAETKTGRPYGETLGYFMNNGILDYSTLVTSVTDGPYVYNNGNIFESLPFTDENISIFKNGIEIDTPALNPFDVYYYSENLRSLWIFSERVSGIYTMAAPSSSAPTSVTVAGVPYTGLSNEAAFKLSDRGVFSMGDQVTLLLGMNGEVVDVVAPEISSQVQYGLVTDSKKSTYTDSAGRIVINNSITVACTDGVLRQYPTGNRLFSKGNIVSISLTGNDTIIKTMTPSYFSGSLNADATRYGTYEIADDVEIIDTNSNGDFKRVFIERLKDTSLTSYNIKYHTVNEDGKIDRMILNNATGDLETYGIVTEVEESTTLIESPPSLDPTIPQAPPTIQVFGLYEYQINGVPGVYQTNTDLLEISEGAAVFWYRDGLVDNIYNMTGFVLDTLTPTSATRLNETYKIAEDVQVYQRFGGDYFLVNIATVSDTEKFNLIGYRDSGFKAGGLIRVIIATPK